MTEGLDQAISAAVVYLEASQQLPGHFRVWNSVDPSLPPDSTPEDSVFATACILYCLEWLHTPVVEQIRQKALAFLRAEGSAQGLFRYYASNSKAQFGGGRQTLPFTIPFDVDTTSCASFILRRYGMAHDNRQLLLTNLDASGDFLTWLMREPLSEEQDKLPFVCLVPKENITCSGVTANALFYLGECNEVRSSVQHLADSACNNTYFSASSYYLDEIVLCYLYSRAYFEGVEALVNSRQALVERILRRQRPAGAFGTSLQTAQALCTLMNFDTHWTGRETAAQSLLASQNSDGSWERCSLYVGDPSRAAMKYYLCLGDNRKELPIPDTGDLKHFGSEEITTAYCLEALSRFREANQ